MTRDTVQKLRRLLITLVLLVTVAWLTISWIEAGKEVRILCRQFAPGDSLHDVIRQLETGHFLRYAVHDEGTARSITFDSHYNLRATRCSVLLEDGLVRERRYQDGCYIDGCSHD